MPASLDHRLADEVLREAKLRAARQATAANRVGGLPQGGDGSPPLPSLEVAPANRVKGRGAMPRQVQNRGWARSREGDDARTVNAPALVLVVDNGMRGVHRRPYGASPASAPRSPLLIVIEGGRHAALANSPNSSEAFR
jgi:hypothetical protein